jgi:hypothetical protein
MAMACCLFAGAAAPALKQTENKVRTGQASPQPDWRRQARPRKRGLQ